MRIVEINALENGAHRNQTTDRLPSIPSGWAVIPDDMVCENFPFGELTAKEFDGVMIVTDWKAGEIPEPIPEPEIDPEPSVEERIDTLEEALNMILEGTVE